MQKKFLALVVLFVLALASASTLAQASWAAYLYNGNTGELVRVNPDGSQAVSALGLEPGAFISSYDMAFTTDGERLAFCAVTYPGAADPASTAPPHATFYLRDIAAQTYLMQLDLGDAIGCRTGRGAFNADDSQVSISRINYYPGDPSADLSQPAWQITLLDIAGGMTINELNSNSPAVAAYEGLSKGGILPFVQSFEGSRVIFAEVPYGIGGGAQWNAYVWDSAAGTVEPVGGQWGIFSRDTLASTGETVWVTKDENLPAGMPGGPVPDNNIVRVADSGGAERTIFHSPDWVVLDARFIGGGERLAIQLLSSFDPNAADPSAISQTIRWVALDRNGQVADLLSSSGNPAIAAAPGGYVALNQEFTDPSTGASQFTLVYDGGAGAGQVWTSPDPFAYWELAWVTPSPAAQGLQPFVAIG